VGGLFIYARWVEVGRVIVDEFPVFKLAPGMTVIGSAGRQRIHEIYDHNPVPCSQDFGRAKIGERWITWDDGKGKRGPTSVFDVEDRVRAAV
jgi:hypothetical protein